MAAEKEPRIKYEYDLRKAWANLHRLYLLSRQSPEARESYWAACVTTEAHLNAVEGRGGKSPQDGRRADRSHRDALVAITRNAESFYDGGA